MTDELGRVTYTKYDEAGRPVQTILPAVWDYDTQSSKTPTVTTWYDLSGNVTDRFDARGSKWHYEYDGRNRKLSETQPALTVLTEPGSGSADGTLVTVSPLTTWTYDLVGNPVTVTDPRGNTSTTRYDRLNRPVLQILPAVAVEGRGTVNPATRTTYDLSGNVLTVESGTMSGAGASASFQPERTNVTNTWDVLNRLASTTDAAGILVSYEYDLSNNRTKVTDGKSQSTQFIYDGLNRLVSTTYADNASERRTYDGVNLVLMTDPNGAKTYYNYDLRNRLKTVGFGAALDSAAPNVPGRVFARDAAGNILSVSEYRAAAGGSSAVLAPELGVAYTYDALNRATSEQSAGFTHFYAYDLNGNRRKVTYASLGNAPASRRSLESTYDAVGRLFSVREGVDAAQAPQNGTPASVKPVWPSPAQFRDTSYAYDKAGNLRQKSLPTGDHTLHQVDALGRVASIERRSPSGDTQSILCNFYDLFGNLARIQEGYLNAGGGASRIRSIVNGYDGANRLTSESTPVLDYATGQETQTVTAYAYDAANNRTSKSVTGPEPQFWSYRYNARNQMTDATRHSDGTLAEGEMLAGSSLFSYDANGSRTSRTTYLGDWNMMSAPASIQTTYAFDPENRLIATQSATDLPGTVTAAAPPPPPPPSGGEPGPGPAGPPNDGGGYYTELPGTLRPSGPGWPALSAGDKFYVGTVSGVIQGGLSNGAYPVKVYTGASSMNYTGPVKVMAPHRYAYDYRTRRVLRYEGGVRTLVSFSGGTSVQEYALTPDGQGGEAKALDAEFIRGSDLGGGIGGILYSLRGTDLRANFYNSRGDVIAQTDATGSLTYAATYEAFGKHGEAPGTHQWGTSRDRQRANTKEEDPTGLLNEGFRYRDLETGTFLTQDPAGFVDGPNLYAYVLQNPWTKFDPEGLEEYDDGYFDSGKYWKDFGNSLKSKDNTGVGGFFKEFAGNAFVTLGTALTPKDHHENYDRSVDRVAAAASATSGDNIVQQAVSAGAAAVSELAGTTNIIEGGYGVDVQGNTLTDEQRVMKGTEGVTKAAAAVATATSLTQSAISALTAEAEAPAGTPVGRLGAELKGTEGVNTPTKIAGRDYSGHALDRMQARGITPRVVENTVQNGVKSPGNKPGTTEHYDAVNGVKVITDTATGRVITVYGGKK